VTGWDGGPATGGGRIVAAGDRRLHEAALRLLNP
jgi:myo-inositol-1(or 4)-monophosphatase